MSELPRVRVRRQVTNGKRGEKVRWQIYCPLCAAPTGRWGGPYFYDQSWAKAARRARGHAESHLVGGARSSA